MVEDGELFECSGYNYEDIAGGSYVEMHVDDHPFFQDEYNTLPFGGNLSVQKKPYEKAVIIIGQDECIFKQYTLNGKSWSCPDGTRALLPKDDGQGVMISAFTCKELGFGASFSGDELDKVNVGRRIGKRKNYVDEKSAKQKYGTSKKHMLTKSPFVRLLEYSSNNDGYWTYEAMVL
jgi:hypothetical protein